jgi:uncharacterized protein DUF6306
MIIHPVHGRRKIMTSRIDNAPASEPSSPACSMHEADDAYMGYAGKEELTAILTELLEAERPGVRVTHESALTARGGPLGELMRAIEKDEARWCAMLAGHLRMLGQPPSSKLGAFYNKAMAISDLAERIAFLNRDQAGSCPNCASCSHACAVTACMPI